jgi:hypothetical protein
MATEWAALWCHFVWSGVFTMLFALVAWQQMGIVMAPMYKTPNQSESTKEATNQRKKLLRIAVMVSLCLLVMMGAMLSVSTDLEERSQTADIALTCSIKENFIERNWEAYGLNEVESAVVCSAEEANSVDTQFESACVSGCRWDPSVSTLSLGCETEENSLGRTFCDCPCSTLITVEKPSVGILALAHVAESFVVIIVGLNLGFRKENLGIWQKFFKRRFKSTSIAAQGQEEKCVFDSKAYD